MKSKTFRTRIINDTLTGINWIFMTRCALALTLSHCIYYHPTVPPPFRITIPPYSSSTTVPVSFSVHNQIHYRTHPLPYRTCALPTVSQSYLFSYRTTPRLPYLCPSPSSSSAMSLMHLSCVPPFVRMSFSRRYKQLLCFKHISYANKIKGIQFLSNS